MHIRIKAALCAFAAALAATPLLASGQPSYHVTITNITHSINLTPILVASHRRDIGLFDLGSPASDDLAAIAEGGDTSGLAATLAADPHVIDVQSSGGLLGPGQSVTVIVEAGWGARRISIASMMLPTNDAFIALDGVAAPHHRPLTYFSPGYDAGSEANDEWCMHIPGPTCMGAGPSPGTNPGDEGYVHIHRGIHGGADLNPAVYDWRNPVARISISRVAGH